MSELPPEACGHVASSDLPPALGAHAASGDLPPRSRGVIGLLEQNCTACMLCARECPDWCLYIEAHKEDVPPLAPGGRPRSRNVLDRFAIDFSLCMYCGICVDVCPFDALFWAPTSEYAGDGDGSLVHEREQLRAWMQDVPPPPPSDRAGGPAKEVLAAQKLEPGPAR